MSTTLFDLTGRTALVTGAGRGIGFAIAQGLANVGARVIVNGRLPEKIEKAAARPAAVFLASSASDFVNGQMLYVDGGMLAVL